MFFLRPRPPGTGPAPVRRALPARRTVGSLAAAAVLAGTLVAQTSTAHAASEIDFTDYAGVLTAGDPRTGDEGTPSVLDNNNETKYLTFSNSGWLQFATSPSVVNRYAITSANDYSGRDPKNWTLQASNDGTTFRTLDTRVGEQFVDRYQERSFSFTNSTAYRYYRLSISANNGDGFLQLAEWQLFGPSSTQTTVAALGLGAQALAPDQVQLTWTKHLSQKAFDVERSTDGQTWSALPGAVNLRGRFRDYSARPSTTYQYRVRTKGPAGVSAWKTTQATTPALVTPPSTQTANNKFMTLRYVNDDVAIYVEPGRTDADAAWSYPEIARIWRYTKQHYPGIGTDRLQVLMFEPEGGGTAHNRTDAAWGYQSTIEIGWHAENSGTYKDGPLDVAAHEIGHIVEGWNGNVVGSPEYGSGTTGGIWGDSAWNDFFMYDVFLGLGRTVDANRTFTYRMSQEYADAWGGKNWFKDWFYPIWNTYGRTDVLNRYFELVRTQYPQIDQQHTRNMTFGEFVHFFSGAAGADLKPLATTAFGWTAENQQQLEQARREFPGVTYPHS
jgi:F5/8 type C domain